MTDLNRLFKWLTIFSTLVALFVFLLSIVSPFYGWSPILIGGASATYWSYRADYFSGSLPPPMNSWQYWFLNYWFNANSIELPSARWIPWIPLALFVMQALTLAFGSASLVANRKTILSVPICSSLTALALMSLMSYELASSANNGAGYQVGYYLGYPSLALFALAFALNEVRAGYFQSKEFKKTSLSS